MTLFISILITAAIFLGIGTLIWAANAPDDSRAANIIAWVFIVGCGLATFGLAVAIVYKALSGEVGSLE